MLRQTISTVLVVSALGFGAVAQAHPDHAFAKDVDAFHALLAPVWHARPGAERTRNACAQADGMENAAQNIQSVDATALKAAVAVLSRQCKVAPAEIDAALFAVHEAFHHLIDAKAPVAGR